MKNGTMLRAGSSALVTSLSYPDGARFIMRHEGFVSKAYRCPAGVWTIGCGFTWGSRTFRDYWMKTRGHKLRRGDTITREESEKLLRAAANEEYGAAVVRALAPTEQHHFDAATSVTFNCGPDTLGDRWAKALKAGNVSGAAALLRKTRVTARGKRLKGLVNRRGHEARLLEFADYGATGGHARGKAGKRQTREQTEVIRDYQKKLIRLGFDCGPSGADGDYGKQTRAAVLNFQRTRADLKNDGILGRATMAQIDRAIDETTATRSAAGGLAATGLAAGAAAVSSVPAWAWWALAGFAVVILAAGLAAAFYYRGDRS